MDVIKLADYIIDIGPEGGKGGGQLLPKELGRNIKSKLHCTVFLKITLVEIKLIK
jgi:excinuclease UvrABC ATPase subunit